MTTLVVGASGATGRLVVKQLLAEGERVSVIVRSMDGLPETFARSEGLTITVANLLDLSDEDLLQHVQGCRAIVSCLGHNMSIKGMFGQPTRLVAQGVQRLCQAVEKTTAQVPVKFVLMNTTGNSNRDIPEVVPLSQRIVIAIIRKLLPPHLDNELAADFLRQELGQNNSLLEWVVVRPDGLFDEDEVTVYDTHVSPTRNAIFDAGTTSRINVASFMVRLVNEDLLWSHWKGKMPVIYNDDKNGNML